MFAIKFQMWWLPAGFYLVLPGTYPESTRAKGHSHGGGPHSNASFFFWFCLLLVTFCAFLTALLGLQCLPFLSEGGKGTSLLYRTGLNQNLLWKIHKHERTHGI